MSKRSDRQAAQRGRRTSRSGRRRWMMQAGVLTASTVLPSWAPRAGAQSSTLNALPRVALVIGNSRYAEAPLKNPGNDAKAIASELQKVGFKVNLQVDAGRAQMVEAIRAFGADLAKTKCVGLFYYAGHGAQLAWRNYLIPVDAAIEKLDDMQDKTVELSSLLQGLVKARNPMNVIILDACRDNPFGTKVPTERKGLSQFDAPPGSLLAYATSPGNTAADGEGANGLYTENLLREIGVPDAKIEDVFKRVRLAVRRSSVGQQIPWESTSLEDDFYFLPPSHVKKLSEAEIERQYNEELAAWEKIKESSEPAPLENYIRDNPSGRFSELAQFQLDRVLAEREKAAAIARAEREKAAAPVNPKPQPAPIVTIASAPPPPRANEPAVNPFTKGTGKVDANYRVGDRYIWRLSDTLTQLEVRQAIDRVREVTDTRVVFGDGSYVRDLLGNVIKQNGREYTNTQIYVAEYSVGKKWVSRSEELSTNGQRYQIEYEIRVVGRENVTVPAGTFDAFKVEGSGHTMNTGTGLHFTYWIAPDQCRRPLLSVTENRNNSGRLVTTDRWEILAFRQTSLAEFAPVQPQAGLVPDGEWRGTYSGGPVLTPNSKAPNPFSVRVAMKTRGHVMTMLRENKDVSEWMSGTIDADGRIKLRGDGYWIDGRSASWRMRFDGRFDGKQFQATGALESNDGKTKYRDLTLALELVTNAANTPSA